MAPSAMLESEKVTVKAAITPCHPSSCRATLPLSHRMSFRNKITTVAKTITRPFSFSAQRMVCHSYTHRLCPPTYSLVLVSLDDFIAGIMMLTTEHTNSQGVEIQRISEGDGKTFPKQGDVVQMVRRARASFLFIPGRDRLLILGVTLYTALRRHSSGWKHI